MMRPGRGQPERRERMDRDKLKDLLFEQFEKHQVTGIIIGSRTMVPSCFDPYGFWTTSATKLL